MAGQKKINKNYMDNIPKRSDQRPWRIREDGVAEIDVENKGFYHFIAQKFFGKPRVSHIALDAHGSVVWQSIDGKNSVHDIVRIMEQKFPGEKSRMLDRVVTYIAMLQRNEFITMEVKK